MANETFGHLSFPYLETKLSYVYNIIYECAIFLLCIASQKQRHKYSYEYLKLNLIRVKLILKELLHTKCKNVAFCIYKCLRIYGVQGSYCQKTQK